MIHIQDIMRAGHIKRWNIVNTTRQQTLAEHMYNVTMIAWQLCEEMDVKYKDLISAEVLKWSLIHDIPEVVCGDTPTPTKNRMKKAGLDMEVIYDEIDPAYKQTKLDTCGLSKWIVKVADTIEGYWFIREHGVGNHAKAIADSLYHRVHEMIDNQPDRKAADVVRSLMNRIISGPTYE